MTSLTARTARYLLFPLSYRPDTFLVNLVRIGFYFLSIVLAANYFDQRVLLTGSTAYTTYVPVYTVLWMFFSALNIIGLTNVVTRLLAWFFCVCTLTSYGAPFNVEVVYCTVPSFLFIFMNFGGAQRAMTSPEEKQNISGWLVFIAGVLFSGYVFFGGGIAKLVDPQWRYGVGYYYTLALTWIRPSFLAFLLKYPVSLFIMNYVAILFEFIMLPLFLIPATRRLSMLFFAAFVFQLLILNIGKIGMFGFFYALFVLSNFTRLDEKNNAVVRFLTKLMKGISFLKPLNDTLIRRAVARIEKLSGRDGQLVSGINKLAFSVLASVIAVQSVLLAFDLSRLRYPLTIDSRLGSVNEFKSAVAERNLHEVSLAAHQASMPLAPNSAKHDFSFGKELKNQMIGTATSLNRRTIFYTISSLFTHEHNLGVSGYTIEVVMKDGTKMYPIRLFEMDGNGGPHNNDQIFSNRMVQVYMYVLSGLYTKVIERPAESAMLVKDPKVHKIMKYALSCIPEEQRKDVKEMNLMLIPFNPPYDYDKPEYNAGAKPFLLVRYDHSTGTLNTPAQLPYIVYGTRIPVADQYLIYTAYQE